DKEIFNQQLAALKTSLKDSVELLNFHRMVQPFTALSKLAHCSSEFPFQSHYIPYMEQGGKLFPCSVRIEEGKLIITDNYSTKTEIGKGDELSSINAKSADVVREDIYAYLSGEGAEIKNALIDQLEFARIYWLVYDEVASFDLVLKRPADGKSYEVSVLAREAAQLEENFAEKVPLFDTERAFKFIEDIAYLKPGIFLNQESTQNTSSHETFDRRGFIDFIDSSFAQIKSRKLESLIIDLRGNPGGDNSFSDYMLAYFADTAFRFCSDFYVKTSPTTKKFWEGVEMESLQEMRKLILEKENGERFPVPYDTYEPRPLAERFRGKVYLLINRYSYSNAVSTAAIVKDYGLGTILGEMTADTPTSYGAVHQFSLPHSKINISYPKAFIVRPNGNRQLLGVKPDIFLTATPGNKEDEVLAASLEFIKNQQP
ncbi:MAG: S41 family peptidase, partial [Bacteroidota bacterium]